MQVILKSGADTEMRAPGTGVKYVAVMSAKNGKVLYQSGAYATREQAAAMAFRIYPRHGTCSTSKAVWKDAEWQPGTTEIQQHPRKKHRVRP